MTTSAGRHARDTRVAAGFSMIELLVVMSIASTLAAVGIFGFTSYQRTAEHKGTQQQLTSQFRNVAERSVSEGRIYCVSVASGGAAYSIWRTGCGTGTLDRGPVRTQDSRVTIAATVTVPTPAPSCPAGERCVYFYPRGTATPAQLVVSSSARSTTYTIRVEGLTARVY